MDPNDRSVCILGRIVGTGRLGCVPQRGVAVVPCGRPCHGTYSPPPWRLEDCSVRGGGIGTEDRRRRGAGGGGGGEVDLPSCRAFVKWYGKGAVKWPRTELFSKRCFPT